jgi:catechol 2,3-dioxygenase-like lactoylglutathione lyase family enzyme
MCIMPMLHTIPALPVRDVAKSIPFYRDKLGFTLRYSDTGFAIFIRDDVEIHLWQAEDESWQTRSSSQPVCSGAESFIAGTASCRVQLVGGDDLHSEMQPLGILHPKAQIADQPWGTREFGVIDPDNNLITFFERVAVPA